MKIYQKLSTSLQVALFGLFVLGVSATAQEWHFTDVTETSGIDWDPASFHVSVSAGDFDGDGWIDLFTTTSTLTPNMLWRNKGDGTFEEIGAAQGIESSVNEPNGSLFFDFDGDGRLDILTTGSQSRPSVLFHNTGEGFVDITEASGMATNINTQSAAAGDYNKDGWIDVYIATYDTSKTTSYLYRNNGDNTFTNVAAEAGFAASEDFEWHWEFSPNFVDVNGDSYQDLLVVGDFDTTQVYINNGDGTFTNTTTDVFTDTSGMGSAIGDYDNDGDLDWFVSSVWDNDQNPTKPWGVSTGNRLYRNDGNGVFEDATDEAGVRLGYWGWGSSFSDFNNDGMLDIFHTNGFIHPVGPFFTSDPSRLFVANGDGTFTERAEELGVATTEIGNGITVFDFDKDGDLDLFVANTNAPPRLFRNDGGNDLSWLRVNLLGGGYNSQALGAKVYASDDDSTQLRVISAGTNFHSNNPTIAHFGLGAKSTTTVQIVWPSGVKTRLANIGVNRELHIPELSLSSDDTSVSYFQYFKHVRDTIHNAVSHHQMSDDEGAWLQHNLLKTFVSERYGLAKQ